MSDTRETIEWLVSTCWTGARDLWSGNMIADGLIRTAIISWVVLFVCVLLSSSGKPSAAERGYIRRP